MTLKELEQTIAQLPPAELAEFREWFLRFDGACWDEQIAKDASSEKLASLAETAHREGRPALKGWATFGCRGATTDGTALAQDRWGDKRTSASNGREISAGNAKTPNAKNPGAGPGFWSGEDRIRTCGRVLPLHRFSKPALSTTQPPLQRPQF